jgi:catalase
VNRPISPVNNYQRDGFMNISGNIEGGPNYFPNSMDDIIVDKNYKEASFHLDSDIADSYDRNENDDDHYTQPGWLFRKVMNDEERRNTINNIVTSMNGIEGPKRNEIIQRQLNLFFKVDGELAEKVGQGLGLISQTYSKLIN